MKILVIEDELKLAGYLHKGLTEEGEQQDDCEQPAHVLKSLQVKLARDHSDTEWM